MYSSYFPSDAIVRMLEPIAHSESVLLEEAKAAVAVCDLHFLGKPTEYPQRFGTYCGCYQQAARPAGSETWKVTFPASQREGEVGRGSYKWISRWRSKWNMPKARIQDRDAPTPSELMLQKVRP